MKERGILYTGAMVLAVLAETKTQTRRGVKATAPADATSAGVFFAPGAQYDGEWNWLNGDPRDSESWSWVGDPFRCPYGVPGDQLWVRETFFAYGRWETRFNAKKGRDEWHFIDMTVECGNWYFYAATSEPDRVASFRRDSGVTPMWWKRPAIFMPRAASRITLEVTDVRVERLQDISEADAIAEGIQAVKVMGVKRYACEDGISFLTAADAYRSLWESINGTTGPNCWDANPFVWIVEFKRITP